MIRRLIALTIAMLLCCGAASARELRVCADPNNLPYSNADGEGFENRVMQLIADDLGATVKYTWWAQRRGFARNTLNAGVCDVIPGVASNLGILGTTQPYYRSSYVFVSRADRQLALSSLDDPRLRELRIGVQLIGDDGANTPPAHALARRGITGNVRGYMVYGDYRDRTPQSAIVDALAAGDIDVAIVWGPTAGYFSAKQAVPMTLSPVSPWLDGPQWPMVFDVSMAVRKDDRPLRRELNRAIERRRTEIDAILKQFGVPRVAGDQSPAAAATNTPAGATK
jgi:mxaJ protein